MCKINKIPSEIHNFFQRKTLRNRVATSLIIGVTVGKDFKKSLLPSVLIVDDSDLTKTGLRVEEAGQGQGVARSKADGGQNSMFYETSCLTV